MSPRQIEIIDIPTSAGANSAGIEEAPLAMRKAGLLDTLRRCDLSVVDRGDPPAVWTWRDEGAGDVTTSNTKAVVDYARHTEARVSRAHADGHLPLVLGGDCSIEIGVVSALSKLTGRVGLLYIDGHADLNVPGSVPEGTGEFLETLDWMGVAHMLDLEGAVSDLVGVGARRPLLAPLDVAVFGFVPEQASAFEHQQIERLGLTVINWDCVAKDPDGQAAELLRTWGAPFDRIAVHLDVDVLNFSETPLADIGASQDVGLKLAELGSALSVFAADPRFASLTITEINPAKRGANGAFDQALNRFNQMLSAALCAENPVIDG